MSQPTPKPANTFGMNPNLARNTRVLDRISAGLRAAYTITLVDTVPALHVCLGEIFPASAAVPTSVPPTLAVDLEGTNLCREGTVSIIQVMRVGSDKVWLIDVTVLGQEAFECKDVLGVNLRTILEDSRVTKLLFDARNDSDAIYNIHGVLLSGVYDLQLLEIAVRLSLGRRARLVAGLNRTIAEYLNPPASWTQTKEEGRKLFLEEHGGSHGIFDKRPLDSRLIAYSAQDVTLLALLKEAMTASMGWKGRGWNQRIIRESERRVNVAKDPDYVPNHRDKALAPTSM